MNKINYEQRKEIYEIAQKTWGIEPQCWMVIEEMSELAKELCKLRRGKDNLSALADEIADVSIMLEQLRIMFGLNEQACHRMDVKVMRLCFRLGIEPELMGILDSELAQEALEA